MPRSDIGSMSELSAEQELDLYMQDVVGYCKGGVCDYTAIYPHLIPILCDAYQVSPYKVLLLDHEAVGETCIYIDGKWSGYVSDWDK